MVQMTDEVVSFVAHHLQLVFLPAGQVLFDPGLPDGRFSDGFADGFGQVVGCINP